MAVKKRTPNSGSESSHGGPSKRRAVPASASELEEHLPTLKLHLRKRLLSPHSHVAPEISAASGLKGVVDQLLEHRESNSVLLLGPPSSTDSILVRGGIDDSAASQMHILRLTGSLHRKDRTALRELVRQLVQKGALTQLHAAHLQLDEEADPEADPLSVEESGAWDWEASDPAEGPSSQQGSPSKSGYDPDEEAGVADVDALFSVNAVSSHLLSFLASQGVSAQTKPIILVLEDFDSFALRPKQELLYVLLDAVQSSSYAPGMLVVAQSARLDTIDLLEKRVKSRFSNRVLHCLLPSSLDMWLPAAIRPIVDWTNISDLGESSAFVKFAQVWSQTSRAAFEAPSVHALLSHQNTISNDLRQIHQIWLKLLPFLTVDQPYLRSEDVQSVLESCFAIARAQLLENASKWEASLLKASLRMIEVHNIPVFTLAMLIADIEADNSGQGPFETRGKRKGFQDAETIALYRRAFQTLMNSACLVPDATISAQSLSEAARRPWPIAPKNSSLDFVKVQLAFHVQDLASWAQSKRIHSRLTRSGG